MKTFLKFFQRKEEKRIITNALYEASITLIPKLGKDTKKKKNTLVPLINTDVKSYKNISN
jgi:hypothetical protein